MTVAEHQIENDLLSEIDGFYALLVETEELFRQHKDDMTEGHVSDLSQRVARERLAKLSKETSKLRLALSRSREVEKRRKELERERERYRRRNDIS